MRAEVSAGRLGISAIHLPCDAVRDYFYVPTRGAPWGHQAILYDTFRTTPNASLAELRLAFKIRQLEAPHSRRFQTGPRQRWNEPSTPWRSLKRGLVTTRC